MSSMPEWEWAQQHYAHPNDSDELTCVRVRGIPEGCTIDHLAQFFEGYATGDAAGQYTPPFYICSSRTGQRTGDAFAIFRSADEAGALQVVPTESGALDDPS